MKREVVHADAAPKPAGPYSEGVIAGGVLYSAGMLPVDPATGRLITGEPYYQTQRVLKNLQALCEAAGTALNRAARVTIHARNLDALPEINRAYEEFFDREPPARIVVGVAELPLGPMCGIEIDAVVPVE